MQARRAESEGKEVFIALVFLLRAWLTFFSSMCLRVLSSFFLLHAEARGTMSLVETVPHGICGRSQRRAGDRFRRRGDGKILRLCVTRVLRRSSLALAEKRSYLRIALLFIGLELETIFACILPMLYFSSVLILFLLIFLFICFFGVCGHLRAYAC